MIFEQLSASKGGFCYPHGCDTAQSVFICISPEPVLICEFLCCRSVVAEIPVLPGCDAASEGSWFPSFRGNVVVLSLKVEMTKKSCISTLKNGTTTLYFETTETNFPVTLCGIWEECTWKWRIGVLNGPSGDLSPSYVSNKERKLYLVYSVCMFCCTCYLTYWLPAMTVVDVGCEKMGIVSSQHLIFNYTQQRHLSEHKFVLSVLPHIRSLHDSEALTFLLADNKNKNTTSQCVCVCACVCVLTAE